MNVPEELVAVKELESRLHSALPGLKLERDVPLSKLTSFRIGGPAALVAYPKDETELIALVRLARGVPHCTLGAGSNVLAPDEGYSGLVIRTKECLTGERVAGTQLYVCAGTAMARAAVCAADAGLSGLEFAHGIPGTVGGGLFMNAGAYGGEMRQVATVTRFLHPDGRVETYCGEAQGFGYRSSAFQAMPGVILSTEFSLAPGDPAQIRETMRTLAQKRRASQPLELPSAGSAFKRPATGYAAALIDQAGLKGLRVGGAAVSEKHAGFLVNLGGATAADVRALLAAVQERVWEACGVRLEPEIRILGEDMPCNC